MRAARAALHLARTLFLKTGGCLALVYFLSNKAALAASQSGTSMRAGRLCHRRRGLSHRSPALGCSNMSVARSEKSAVQLRREVEALQKIHNQVVERADQVPRTACMRAIWLASRRFAA